MKVKLKYWARPLNTIHEGFAYQTEREAIENARIKVEETDDPYVVVQVIKVVKPQHKPVVIEDAE